jgi:esterase/lipase
MKLFRLLCLAALLVTCTVMLLSSCQHTRKIQFAPSDSLVPSTITPFTTYQQAVADWLSAHRQSTGFEPGWEVQINTPFECGVGNTKGVLFIHGLGDSPYFFHDVAEHLCERNVWVRAILLPGHGSKPGDMLNASYALWQQTTNFHVEQFSRKVDELYLAGFSTGTNLAVVATSQRSDIAGLLLFSPAFESRFAVTWLAPYLTGLLSWPNVEPEDNPTRYNSMAMQGFAAYQKSVDAVQASLQQKPVTLPALLVVPEGDSVVDVNRVSELYAAHFRHPTSQLLWLGEEEDAPANSQVLSMQIPAQRIGAASHMSVLFSAANPLYGIGGTQRICDNGQGSSKTKRCEAGEEVWYGPWGLTEEGKVFARLTYNPYFDTMMGAIEQLLEIDSQEVVKE